MKRKNVIYSTRKTKQDTIDYREQNKPLKAELSLNSTIGVSKKTRTKCSQETHIRYKEDQAAQRKILHRPLQEVLENNRTFGEFTVKTTCIYSLYVIHSLGYLACSNELVCKFPK